MPPACSFDVAGVGPTFLLKTSLDNEAGRVRQRISVPGSKEDPHFLRDLKMVACDLEAPPRIEPVADGECYDLLFALDTDEETIPALTELIMQRVALRRERKREVRASGPAMAINGDLSDRFNARR